MSLALEGRSCPAALSTVITPAIDLSSRPLKDLAEVVIAVVFPGAEELDVRAAELSSLLNGRWVLNLEDGLFLGNVWLVLAAEIVTEARLEDGEVKVVDHSRDQVRGVLLTDEQVVAGLGGEGVGVVGEGVEVFGVVVRRELETGGVSVVPSPGVNVVWVDGIATLLNGAVQTSLHDLDDVRAADVDVPLFVIEGEREGLADDRFRKLAAILVPSLDGTTVKVANDNLVVFLCTMRLAPCPLTASGIAIV
jgi:hypothetical protein